MGLKNLDYLIFQLYNRSILKHCSLRDGIGRHPGFRNQC